MKIDLSYDDRRIVKQSLRNRIEDLTRFSRECEIKGQKACMLEFAEMANDCQEVLDKFEALDKD